MMKEMTESSVGCLSAIGTLVERTTVIDSAAAATPAAPWVTSVAARSAGLLELQPSQIPNLDRRVGRSAGVLAAERSLFAVQIAVSPVTGRHRLFLAAG